VSRCQEATPHPYVPSNETIDHAIVHPIELGACLHDRRGERAEVVQMFDDDGLDNSRLRRAYAYTATLRKPTIFCKRLARSTERMPAACNSANASRLSCGTPSFRSLITYMARSMIVSQALDIQDDRVLFRLICDPVLLVVGIFFEHTLEASFTGGDFVEDNVVSHGPTHARRCPSGYLAAPRGTSVEGYRVPI
jgi:hypothetical protein